jgi:hypothetical protein
VRGNGPRESGHDAPQLGPTVGKLAIPGWYSGLGCQPVRCCAGHDYLIWPGWTGGHENAVLRRRASRVRYHPVGAENRVILCDLGVLVNEVAKPVSSQNAPSGAVAGPRVHPRCTAGMSEVQRPGSFRASALIGFLCRYWWRSRIVSTAHASSGSGSPLSRNLHKVRW